MRNRGNVCTFCGADIPPSTGHGSGVMSGPALCVCQVIAGWRCNLCDTPVCEQHRNRFWPGQSRDNVRLASRDEWVVWNETTNAAASAFRSGAREACTVCRSERAGDLLDRLRGIAAALSPAPFPRGRALAEAGIHSEGLVQSFDAKQLVDGLVDHLRSRGASPVEVATTWRVRANVAERPSNEMSCWLLRIAGSNQVLVARADAWLIAGPTTLVDVGMLVPGPDARIGRDLELTPWNPSSRVPGSTYAKARVRWRDMGTQAQHLGLASYRSLILPTL